MCLTLVLKNIKIHHHAEEGTRAPASAMGLGFCSLLRKGDPHPLLHHREKDLVNMHN